MRGSFYGEHGNLCFFHHTVSWGFMNGTRDETLNSFKKCCHVVPLFSCPAIKPEALSSMCCPSGLRVIAVQRPLRRSPPKAQVVFSSADFTMRKGGQPHFSLLHQFYKQGSKSTTAVPKWPHQTVGPKAKPKIRFSI